MTYVLIKRGNSDTETDLHRGSYRGIEGGHGHLQVKETGLEKLFPSQPQKERTLIFDFLPPEL